ncbi:MAG: helicase [Spirochaetes bacterium]|nr:helicase [Spirochaetota bacterium]
MGAKERRIVKQKISEAIDGKNRFCLLATGSLIGEGFDLPVLDVLFLTTPVSYKGKVIQYAGRLHREHEAKIDVSVYDYVDLDSGLTISMFKKRLAAYVKMGYSTVLSDNAKLNRLLEKYSFFKKNS